MDHLALKKAFRKTSHYSRDNALAAIRGQSIPPAVGHPTIQLCLVRGIRYHPGFATELRCKYDRTGLFSRAVNARAIMSNEIPDLKNEWDTPYCIWHPDTASEETYQQLVTRYPHLRYHVGRACAVAGYTELYRELNLLPEIHIAEEARDNNSTAIFNMIMASPVLYNVMNDYTRTVNLHNPQLCDRRYGLNNDTAVRSSLERKQMFSQAPRGPYDDIFDDDDDDEDSRTPRYRVNYWNITEDMNLDEFSFEAPDSSEEDVAPYLYTPLPFDLPYTIINKDLLILMAAWTGDVDRYDRLRRDNGRIMIEKELDCSPLSHPQRESQIQRAITARFIMSNDLSRVSRRESPDEARNLPFCIWYPNLASPETYRELARREPRMTIAVARACIVANYRQVYRELEFEPTKALWCEAQQRPGNFYTDDLRQRAERYGGFKATGEGRGWEETTFVEMSRLFNTSLSEVVTPANGIQTSGYGLPGNQPYAGSVLLNVCAPEDVKRGHKQTLLRKVHRSEGDEELDRELECLGYLNFPCDIKLRD